MREPSDPIARPVLRRFRRLAVMGALAVTLAGCASQEIDAKYGRRRGANGGASVNGTNVLSEMFQHMGHRAITVGRLSRKLDYYDTIVWAPDDFAPPTEEQLEFFDEWLWNNGGGGRTLIYIGRDFDAAPGYWEMSLAEASAEEAIEIRRRQAMAQAAHDRRRAEMPAKQYVRWFVVERDRPRRRIRTVSSPDSDWEKLIDAAAAELEIEGRLRIPRRADVPKDSKDQLPEFAVLLESQGDVLVSRVIDDNWWDSYCDECDTLLETDEAAVADVCPNRQCSATQRHSRVIVVANGSFLLNLPLVNHQHRALAGKLIEECAPGSDVAFVESGPGGPVVVESDPKAKYPTGLEVLTVWPLNAIAFHLIALGILYCVARFPIFGEPRHLEPARLTDFGKHIDAMGDLLQRTRDQAFALGRLRHFQQQVQRETAGSASDSAAQTTKPETADKNE